MSEQTMPAVPSASPLLEADPQSLEELFSLDPLQLCASTPFARRQRDRIVAELRRQREVFARAEAAGQAVPRQKKTSAPSGPALPVNSDDLGL